MNPDTQGRLGYLASTIDLLWPDAPHGTSMVVLPTAGTPRLLVPVRPRRAAAASVLRYTAQQGLRDRAAGTVLAAAVAAGYTLTRTPVRAAAPDVGADSIDDHLAHVLGHPVVTSLALTRDRPNRKPVLQVFDRRGRTVAYAKVGVSDLAATLVRDETAALRRLAAAELHESDVPRVLSGEVWKGHPVLVVSALPSGAAIAPSATDLGSAMREVAAAGAGTTAGYVDALRQRCAGGEVDATTEQWREIFEQLIDTRDLDRLPVGAWHGDWTTWNCSRRDGRVLVWDWERFTDPAPQGFDLLHFVLNDTVGARHGGFRAGAAALVAGADEILAPWGVRGSDALTLALLYLLDIALRYVQDDARSTDAAGRVEEWALPTVRQHLQAVR